MTFWLDFSTSLSWQGIPFHAQTISFKSSAKTFPIKSFKCNLCFPVKFLFQSWNPLSSTAPFRAFVSRSLAAACAAGCWSGRAVPWAKHWSWKVQKLESSTKQNRALVSWLNMFHFYFLRMTQELHNNNSSNSGMAEGVGFGWAWCVASAKFGAAKVACALLEWDKFQLWIGRPGVSHETFHCWTAYLMPRYFWSTNMIPKCLDVQCPTCLMLLWDWNVRNEDYQVKAQNMFFASA